MTRQDFDAIVVGDIIRDADGEHRPTDYEVIRIEPIGEHEERTVYVQWGKAEYGCTYPTDPNRHPWFSHDSVSVIPRGKKRRRITTPERPMMFDGFKRIADPVVSKKRK